jgi:hypothetical protein
VSKQEQRHKIIIKKGMESWVIRHTLGRVPENGAYPPYFLVGFSVNSCLQGGENQDVKDP